MTIGTSPFFTPILQSMLASVEVVLASEKELVILFHDIKYFSSHIHINCARNAKRNLMTGWIMLVYVSKCQNTPVF